MKELFEDYPATLLVLLPLAWVGLMVAIAWLGHWARLASAYRAWAPAEGAVWRAQSAQVGCCNYGHCLIVRAGARGIHVSVLFPFRPGHPPLFVPWDDLSAAAVRRWWQPPIELRFRRVPSARVRISRELAARLRAAAGESWPGVAEKA